MAAQRNHPQVELPPVYTARPPTPQYQPRCVALRWRGIFVVAAAVVAVCAAANPLLTANWPDPDGDGYTEHRCDNTVGYCPADTTVLACHADGNRPQYRNGTPCRNENGDPAGPGEACACDHPDGCYSDCRLTRPSCEADACSMPDVVIEADRDYVFENEEARFLLVRTGDARDTLHVRVLVSETGDMVAAEDEGDHMVTFETDATTATFTGLIARDFEDEPHSDVTVAVVDDPGYRVPVPAEAVVQVRDDAGRLVEFSVDPPARSVIEGETAVFDVVATTVDDGTFETAADLTRVFGTEPVEIKWFAFAGDGEASAGTDFLSVLEDVRIQFDQFVADDSGLSWRWTLPGIVTIADDVAEVEEGLEVVLTGFAQVDRRLLPGDTEAVVTIFDEPVGLRLTDAAPGHYGSAATSHVGRATQSPTLAAQTPFSGSGKPSTVALIAPGRGIADLEPLTAFTGLRRLDLAGNAITDLSPLASQYDLSWLDLSRNAVGDLGPLASLADLRYLKLSGNRVADLWPLANLYRLEVLFLDGNRVADLEPLRSITTLRYLVLGGNRVEDINALVGLDALERLDLYGNPVRDLSPLRALNRLDWLRAPVDVDFLTIPPSLHADGRTLLRGNFAVARAGVLGQTGHPQ